MIGFKIIKNIQDQAIFQMAFNKQMNYKENLILQNINKYSLEILQNNIH